VPISFRPLSPSEPFSCFSCSSLLLHSHFLTIPLLPLLSTSSVSQISPFSPVPHITWSYHTISGDYATFKEKIAKPVSRSFLERKKILQYQYQLKGDGRGEKGERDEGGSDVLRMGQSDGDAVKDEDLEGMGEEQGEGERRDGPRKVSASFAATGSTAAGLSTATNTAAVTGTESVSGAGCDQTAATSGGSGISRSRFLNAIEVSAEGIAVLRKLHEQVGHAASAKYTLHRMCEAR
jgi:hypothetical protein